MPSWNYGSRGGHHHPPSAASGSSCKKGVAKSLQAIPLSVPCCEALEPPVVFCDLQRMLSSHSHQDSGFLALIGAPEMAPAGGRKGLRQGSWLQQHVGPAGRSCFYAQGATDHQLSGVRKEFFPMADWHRSPGVFIFLFCIMEHGPLPGFLVSTLDYTTAGCSCSTQTPLVPPCAFFPTRALEEEESLGSCFATMCPALLACAKQPGP